MAEFKDFYIAVGQPGAYSKSMDYTLRDEDGKQILDRELKPIPNIIALFGEYNIRIKHAPLSLMPKIKNVVVQSWKDEDGDDVWLPRTITRIDNGIAYYKSAITHEAVDYEPTFVIFGDRDRVDANKNIRDFIKRIEGRWLKIWDEYTQIGFEGVYLVDVDDDPKFKRRNYDHVEFTLKFKINGASIDSPFMDLEGEDEMDPEENQEQGQNGSEISDND